MHISKIGLIAAIGGAVLTTIAAASPRGFAAVAETYYGCLPNYAFQVSGTNAVSYTHLDVYKRQRDGYAIRARRPGIAERTWRAARRNPVLASAWSAAIVLGIAFLASVFVQNARVGRERDRATAARDSACLLYPSRCV